MKSNGRVRRVPQNDFVNETCSNNLSMRYIAKQYYTRKRGNKNLSKDDFVYLNYPWLFSTAAKVEAIQFESRLNMEGELENLLNNSDNDYLGFLEGAASLNITVRRSHLLEDTLRMLST